MPGEGGFFLFEAISFIFRGGGMVRITSGRGRWLREVVGIHTYGGNPGVGEHVVRNESPVFDPCILTCDGMGCDRITYDTIRRAEQQKTVAWRRWRGVAQTSALYLLVYSTRTRDIRTSLNKIILNTYLYLDTTLEHCPLHCAH
jgi:hypothetical protein